MAAPVSLAARAVKERLKHRRLPTMDLPEVGANESLARSMSSIQEHLRMYEGDSGAPKERFITLAELENAGLLLTDTKAGFAYISKILTKDVAQKAGSTANPTLLDPVQNDTTRQPRAPGGGGSGGGGAEALKGSTKAQNKLSGIADVNITQPAQGDFLYYDGRGWSSLAVFNSQNKWRKQQSFDAPMKLVELADSPPVAEGYGLLYGKADNVLYWKDSTGTETSLLGGGGGLANIVEDTTPQLGGELDLNNYDLGDTGSFWIKSDNTIFFGNYALDYYATISSAGLIVREGRSLKVTDSSGADSATSSHNGTDYNTVLVNTTNWNITGANVNVPSLASTGAVTGSNLNVSNWDTAYSWGDHALAGYGTGTGDAVLADAEVVSGNWVFTRLDIVLPSAGQSAVTVDRLYLNGREAVRGSDLYLRLNQNDDFTNGLYAKGNLQITGNYIGGNVSNWDTAYGWGDHAAGGYAPTASPTFTGTVAAAALTASGNITANGNIVGDGATTISAIETITVDSTGDITKTSHGNYLFHKSTAYDNDQNGEVTFSTSAASGGTTGDIWFTYTA